MYGSKANGRLTSHYHTFVSYLWVQLFKFSDAINESREKLSD